MSKAEARNCAWVQARIDQYLDEELPAEEVSGLEAHLRGCAECARERDLAGRVRAGLQSLPLQTCPDRVAQAVYARIRDRRRARAWDWVAGRGWWNWRPLAGVAAVVLLVAAAVVYQQQKPGVSPEEVARAERQVRWTLAYLGQVGHRTGLEVRDQVIRARVVDPLQRGVKAALETGAM